MTLIRSRKGRSPGELLRPLGTRCTLFRLSVPKIALHRRPGRHPGRFQPVAQLPGARCLLMGTVEQCGCCGGGEHENGDDGDLQPQATDCNNCEYYLRTGCCRPSIDTYPGARNPPSNTALGTAPAAAFPPARLAAPPRATVTRPASSCKTDASAPPSTRPAPSTGSPKPAPLRRT